MRRRNPLPDHSDGEVLRLAARVLLEQALAQRIPADRSHDLAARLYAIARRVPLWTQRRAA